MQPLFTLHLKPVDVDTTAFTCLLSFYHGRFTQEMPPMGFIVRINSRLENAVQSKNHIDHMMRMAEK